MHRYKFSLKTLTQPQLLACLVLKKCLRIDYRGLAVYRIDYSNDCMNIETAFIESQTRSHNNAMGREYQWQC